jgi:hypothetical protein
LQEERHRPRSSLLQGAGLEQNSQPAPLYA